MDARTPVHLRRARPSDGALSRALAWIAGIFATGAALAVGALLAVFAAATVAVIAVMSGVLVFLTGAAFRARRTMTPQPAVLEARKVGHAWVAYGWDRNGR